MRHLVTTTALTALLAFPAVAQQSGQTGAQDQQVQNGQTGASALRAGQIEIQASSLIGQRLYILREDASAGGMQQPGTAEQPAGDATQTAQDAGQPLETEGAEQAQGEQPMTEGAGTEQAQGEQPMTEAGETEQAEAPAAGMERPAGANMAELEQGVSEVPEEWTMAGEIDDVLMTQEGQVQSLIVDAGGFLGMNDSVRRIDLQQVTFVPNLENEGEFYAVYTGDRAMFEQSEAFDADGMAEGTLRGSETWGEEIRGGQSDVELTTLTSEDLVGTAVYGADDNWVGEISELALSESGEVEAVVVDVGGFLGIGQKPVALTMEQIQLRRGEGGMFRDDLRAYVNATEEELESLPEWEDDRG